jgi:hypothetical protein
MSDNLSGFRVKERWSPSPSRRGIHGDFRPKKLGEVATEWGSNGFNCGDWNRSIDVNKMIRWSKYVNL